MSTLWWIIVCWLACSFSFTLGFIIRGEFQIWARATRATPEPIDFTRRRLGETR